MSHGEQVMRDYDAWRSMSWLTEEELHLLTEAGQRTGLSVADFMLQSAMEAARQIVPEACQAPLEETPMAGLFEETTDE